MQRLEALIESVGIAGVMGIAVVAMVIVIIIMLRGSGLALLLLIITYSLVFVQAGGISTVAFFGRVICLLFLCFGITKSFRSPGWAVHLFLAYVFLGLSFSPFSRFVPWALQRGVLLLLTTTGLTFGVASYLDSPSAIRNVCRMFVAAGVVWTVISVIFLRDFLFSSDLRFQGGGETSPVSYALSGALLLPFMFWAFTQRGSTILRITGFASLVVIPICLFLSGTRTAFVVAAIATLPLMLKRNAKQVVVMLIATGMIGAVITTAGGLLLRGRDTSWVTERLTNATLSGRQERWAFAVGQCMQSPLIGRGIGGSDFAAGFETGNTIFHNAYLSIWYNTGMVGLALVVTVIVSKILAARKLTKSVTDPILIDASRLAFGLILSIAAVAMVENSISGSSNPMVAMFLIACTMIERIRVISEEQQFLVQAPIPPVYYPQYPIVSLTSTTPFAPKS
jgi:O-antigen ligase